MPKRKPNKALQLAKKLVTTTEFSVCIGGWPMYSAAPETLRWIVVKDLAKMLKKLGVK